ncbi:MAG: hypothetical protein ACRDT8_25035, partial [Micromonosporaceae bacterium]
MKLTVGPLPPAVYWRRRAAVLAAILIVVLFVVYSCGGVGKPEGAAVTSSGKGGASRDSPSFVEPSDDDVSPDPGDGSGDGSDGPGAPGPVAPPGEDNSNAPPCVEGDLSIAAEPTREKTRAGDRLRINLVITNTSDRACKGDIGADQQEVQLQQGKGRVWSSDDCKPQTGSHVEVLSPDVPVRRFWVTWDGRTSAPKCE